MLFQLLNCVIICQCGQCRHFLKRLGRTDRQINGGAFFYRRAFSFTLLVYDSLINTFFILALDRTYYKLHLFKLGSRICLIKIEYIWNLDLRDSNHFIDIPGNSKHREQQNYSKTNPKNCMTR
ncbi:hypothetical protein D3C78_1539580 [compost metagenome]